MILVVPFDILSQHLQSLFIFESCLQGFVFTNKTNSQQTIPLHKVNIRQWVFGLDSHDAAFYFWGRLEVIFTNLYQVIYLCQQLHIYAQSAVQIRSRFSNQSLSKLFLEHQNCASEHRFLREQFENKGRTNLIGYIGNTHIKEWQLSCQYISRNQHKLTCAFGILKSFGEFGHHSRVYLNGDHLFGSFQQQSSEVTCAWSDLQNHISGSDCRFDDHLIKNM